MELVYVINLRVRSGNYTDKNSDISQNERHRNIKLSV